MEVIHTSKVITSQMSRLIYFSYCNFEFASLTDNAHRGNYEFECCINSVPTLIFPVNRYKRAQKWNHPINHTNFTAGASSISY